MLYVLIDDTINWCRFGWGTDKLRIVRDLIPQSDLYEKKLNTKTIANTEFYVKKIYEYAVCTCIFKKAVEWSIWEQLKNDELKNNKNIILK